MATSSRQAQEALRRLDRAVQSRFARSVDRTVDAVGHQVQTRVPRASGDLADSMVVLHHRQAKGFVSGSVAIGQDDDSGDAAAVEYGTAKYRPVPFFRPAIAAVAPSIQGDLARDLDSLSLD